LARYFTTVVAPPEPEAVTLCWGTAVGAGVAAGLLQAANNKTNKRLMPVKTRDFDAASFIVELPPKGSWGWKCPSSVSKTICYHAMPLPVNSRR
jgi:hypothetical protein